jgi:hypothetical protein
VISTRQLLINTFSVCGVVVKESEAYLMPKLCLKKRSRVVQKVSPELLVNPTMHMASKQLDSLTSEDKVKLRRQEDLFERQQSSLSEKSESGFSDWEKVGELDQTDTNPYSIDSLVFV